MAGRIRDDGSAADPELAAVELLALVDGLGVHVLGGYCAGDEAVAILDGHLAGLAGSDGG